MLIIKNIPKFFWSLIFPVIGLVYLLSMALFWVSDTPMFSKLLGVEPPKITTTDEVFPSPSGNHKITVRRVVWETEDPSSLFLSLPLSMDVPPPGGYVYVGRKEKDPNWETDWYVFSFAEATENEGGENGHIRIFWNQEDFITVEYCGIAINEFGNSISIDEEVGLSAENEVKRSDQCQSRIRSV
ncbi:MAG: hypothetical protein AAFR72_01305 [Pseudomonadota bacterium]